jgi:hypothetical protein
MKCTVEEEGNVAKSLRRVAKSPCGKVTKSSGQVTLPHSLPLEKMRYMHRLRGVLLLLCRLKVFSMTEIATLDYDVQAVIVNHCPPSSNKYPAGKPRDCLRVGLSELGVWACVDVGALLMRLPAMCPEVFQYIMAEFCICKEQEDPKGESLPSVCIFIEQAELRRWACSSWYIPI